MRAAVKIANSSARADMPSRSRNAARKSGISSKDRAAWCSTDPICIESTGQGFNSLNLGACHACALLPETSCAYANALLDRAFLLGGTPGIKGYFGDVLALARQSAVTLGLE